MTPENAAAILYNLGIPEWLRVGRRVCIAGGPAWVVSKFTTTSPVEVYLTDPGGFTECVWHLDKFLGAWSPEQPVVLTRFNRDDVL